MYILIATKEEPLPRVLCSGGSVSLPRGIQSCGLCQPGRIPFLNFRPLQLGLLPCPQALTTDCATRPSDQITAAKERGSMSYSQCWGELSAFLRAEP